MPMPQGNYSTVFTGPPSRFDGTTRALKIDDALVQKLLTDIDRVAPKIRYRCSPSRWSGSTTSVMPPGS
jgi:hypothetical protein